ncbi:hypothetical protein [Acetobacter garciniae]|nr:hypothetical protein [Acetobacter garciniae]
MNSPLAFPARRPSYPLVAGAAAPRAPRLARDMRRTTPRGPHHAG